MKEFPEHWGPEPAIQTRDIKELPDGYGFGSSTLLGWVNRNIERDKNMNILKKTKTYLVGPMEFEDDGRTWRDDMTEFLTDLGVTVFDPYQKPFMDAPSEDENTHLLMRKLMREGKLDEVHDHYKQVRALDLSMVDRSDFIVGYIDPKTPTYGTTEELATAVRMKRPVFLVVEGGISETPFWLLGMFPPRYFYNSFDEVKEMLTRIDDGSRKINNDRWRLFKKEYR